MSENIPYTDNSPITQSVEISSPVETPKIEVNPHKKFPFFSVILLIILSVVSVIAVYLFLQVRQLSMSKSVPSPLPTQLPDSSVDPTSDWQIYTDSKLGFSFKYPSDYKANKLMVNGKIDETQTNFETESGTRLTLFTDKFISFDEKNLCNTDSAQSACIQTSGWGQSVPVKEISLDGKKAISFYVEMGGSDNDYHLIVTKENPKIQLRMYVSGGGLDRTFSQILSTLKFTGSSTSYTCPTSGYVDCMPGSGSPMPSCAKDAMAWYEANCKDFKGGAL